MEVAPEKARKRQEEAARSPAGPGTPPGTGAPPAGFAGRVNLTVPLVTLLGMAERPGEIPGIGPIDPNPEANTPGRYQIVT